MHLCVNKKLLLQQRWYMILGITITGISLSSVAYIGIDTNFYNAANVLELTPVFAELSSSYTSDTMKWNLVYLTNNKPCSGANYHNMETYTLITEKYLDLYEFLNIKESKSECMSIANFDTQYNIADDTELLIIILEEDLGKSELNKNGINGFYSYVPSNSDENNISKKDKHLILVCDCVQFVFTAPKWFLSHMLSHFVLTYNGYSKAIADEKIHEIDQLYDECTEYRSDSEKCKEIKTSLHLEGKNITLMKPVLEPNPLECPKEYLEFLADLKKQVDEGTITKGAYEKIQNELCGEFSPIKTGLKTFADRKVLESELSLYDKHATTLIRNNYLANIIEKYTRNESTQYSIVLESEDVVTGLGTTYAFILNEKIRSNSVVRVDIENNPQIQCMPPKIVDYGFYVMCDSRLENTLVNYKFNN